MIRQESKQVERKVKPNRHVLCINIGICIGIVNSDLSLRKQTQQNLEKSSMKVRTYLGPPQQGVGRGLVIYECTEPRTCVYILAFSFSQLCSGCFPTTQPMQAPLEVLIGGSPSTMTPLFNAWRYLYFIWPNLSCHNFLVSLASDKSAFPLKPGMKCQNLCIVQLVDQQIPNPPPCWQIFQLSPLCLE